MSNYQKAFASFLARTYYPVNVSFKSVPIAYSNPLFSVSHKINSSYTDNKNKLGYINFDLAINKYNKSKYVNNNKVNTPESFIKFMVDKPKQYTGFQLTNKDKNNNIVEFNTNGLIPLRYLDMLNDFSLHKFNYVKPTELDFKIYECELYEEKIAYINNEILYDIYQYAKYLSEKEKIMKIEIINAPNYPIDTSFIKKYLDKSFRMEETEDYLHENIIERVWKSGDGDFSSPSTKIFFNRSEEYKSLCNIGYSKLFSSSGGIDFSYVSQLPWFQLKRKMGDYQQYYDNKGHDVYWSNSDNIGITEFIILSEILAKEGAEYMLTFEN
jgi:hypothetical protein